MYLSTRTCYVYIYIVATLAGMRVRFSVQSSTATDSCLVGSVNIAITGSKVSKIARVRCVMTQSDGTLFW